MGQFVIACYKPREGKEKLLIEVVKDHVPILRSEGLVTDRAKSLVMRSKDGCIMEIFEWKSPEAIEQAHTKESVKAMWARFEEACEYVKLDEIKESHDMWAVFEPVEL